MSAPSAHLATRQRRLYFAPRPAAAPTLLIRQQCAQRGHARTPSAIQGCRPGQDITPDGSAGSAMAKTAFDDAALCIIPAEEFRSSGSRSREKRSPSRTWIHASRMSRASAGHKRKRAPPSSFVTTSAGETKRTMKTIHERYGMV